MKAGLLCAATLFGCFAIYAGVSHQPTEMGIAAFVGLALLCFANLDRLASFRATPGSIEATIRAEAIVEKAEATLADLQELALVTAKIQVSLLARSGRVGGYSEVEQEALRRETLALLNRIGVSAEKQAEVLADVQRLTALDYFFRVLPSRLPVMSSENAGKWHKFREQAFNSPPEPNDLEAFLMEAKLLHKEAREALEDYRYYLREKKHRRPEVWNTWTFDNDD